VAEERDEEDIFEKKRDEYIEVPVTRYLIGAPCPHPHEFLSIVAARSVQTL
jgi:hypothetical protein